MDISDTSMTLYLSDSYTSVEVTYEGGDNVFYTSSLEIDPAKNHIPMGFLYITNTIKPVHEILIGASPDCLLGNGIDRSIIVVDLVDELGNPVFGETVTVTTELEGMNTSGTLVATGSYMNRFTYIYTAPEDTGKEIITFAAGDKSNSVDIKVR